MELQGREQTEDCLRHFGCNGDQALMLGTMTVGQPVDATPGFLQQTVGRHARKDHPGSPDIIEIAGTYHPLLTKQIKDALGVGLVAHG